MIWDIIFWIIRVITRTEEGAARTCREVGSTSVRGIDVRATGTLQPRSKTSLGACPTSGASPGDELMAGTRGQVFLLLLAVSKIYFLGVFEASSRGSLTERGTEQGQPYDSDTRQSTARIIDRTLKLVKLVPE